jgi:hypothetical protein
MRGPSNAEVFISYARKDGAELAKRLEADLSAEGFNAWLDTERLAGSPTSRSNGRKGKG